MSSAGRIFITGATGFVGMEVLARYLERGEQADHVSGPRRQ